MNNPINLVPNESGISTTINSSELNFFFNLILCFHHCVDMLSLYLVLLPTVEDEKTSTTKYPML
uniref:Transmembrane protein n=1 Tax=Glossina pallidipes TaxID=7398 RepID=A0A1A9ZKM7_GLOPL